ncbi:hypothetical protein BKA69DRAFT_1065550 [Paraphysoderma sedebokerense]|nr:hypothetical protein BKA69DRAFT_1065550 [Paraphysoderma sedebokerense]
MGFNLYYLVFSVLSFVTSMCIVSYSFRKYLRIKTSTTKRSQAQLTFLIQCLCIGTSFCVSDVFVITMANLPGNATAVHAVLEGIHLFFDCIASGLYLFTSYRRAALFSQLIPRRILLFVKCVPIYAAATTTFLSVLSIINGITKYQCFLPNPAATCEELRVFRMTANIYWGLVFVLLVLVDTGFVYLVVRAKASLASGSTKTNHQNQLKLVQKAMRLIVLLIWNMGILAMAVLFFSRTATEFKGLSDLLLRVEFMGGLVSLNALRKFSAIRIRGSNAVDTSGKSGSASTGQQVEKDKVMATVELSVVSPTGESVTKT